MVWDKWSRILGCICLVTTSDWPTLDVFLVSPPVPDTSEALFPCVYKNNIQIYSCVSKQKCTNRLGFVPS